MKKMSIVLAVAAAVVSISAQRGAPPNEPLALVHANVVNVRDGRITSDATLVLRNGRIESIASAPAPPGVRVLNLRGKYVLPGLIDAHTHADNFAAFRRALESGVTTVRSAGVSNYADVGFHELVKKGAVVGPDVVTAGYHVRPQLAHDGRRLVTRRNARDDLDLVAQPEQELERLAKRVVVLHEEDPHRRHSAASRSG